MLCEVAIFCCDKFGSGGYLWLSNSYTVTVAQLWKVFQIVYSCTGSYTSLICKMNGYLCRNEILLAERLWVIFCCSLALKPSRPCKFILVKYFIVANGCVQFGLATLYLSPAGVIWNFIQLCEWGFTFETLPFVMGFLLCFALPKWLLG